MTQRIRRFSRRVAPTPSPAAPVKPVLRSAGALPRAMRRGLLATTALLPVALAAPALAQAPNAAPQGGVVGAGSAAISQNAATTTVNQSSSRAVVDWQRFDVGRSHAVQFNQPNAGAWTLNRVNSPDPSMIAGRITANGGVAIVNQSGVTFAQGAQVNVGSLIASAAGITNENFMAGRMVFDQAARPGARVENHGSITVAERGLAALVGPGVNNAGHIRARLGRVTLAGAEAFTLDLAGDGLVSLDVTRQVTRAPEGAVALVTNSGTIEAAGGTVLLTADAARGVVDTLILNTGRISANADQGARAGSVAIRGSAGGNVDIVSGTVSATGTAPGVAGGSVSISAAGGTVRVARGARVDASGAASGGEVRLGGATTSRVTIAGEATARGTGTGAVVRGGLVAAQAKDAVAVLGGAKLDASGTAGGGTVLFGTTGIGRSQTMAATTTVEAGAELLADATVSGNGGIVVVNSTERTEMQGALSARGGASGGDGGFVEVSAMQTLFAPGLLRNVDVGASAGRSGTLLIDPASIEIVSDTGPHDGLPGDILAGDDTPPPAVSTDPWRVRASDISADASNLILQARESVVVNVDAIVNKGAGALTLETVDSGHAGITINGSVSVADGQTLALRSASAITLNASVSAGATGTVELHTTGQTQQTAGVITAGTLSVRGVSGGTSAAGAVTLDQLNQVASFSVNSSATVAFLNQIGFAVDGITASGVVDLRTVTGDLTQTQRISALSLLARADAGSVLLTNEGNEVTTLAGSAGLGFAYTDATAVAVGSVTPLVAGAAVAGVTATTTADLRTVTGDLTQTQRISALSLLARADAGSVLLTNEGNEVTTLAGSAAGTTGGVPNVFGFRDNDGLLVGSVTPLTGLPAVDGITAPGVVVLRADTGNTTLIQAVTTTADASHIFLITDSLTVDDTATIAAGSLASPGIVTITTATDNGGIARVIDIGGAAGIAGAMILPDSVLARIASADRLRIGGVVTDLANPLTKYETGTANQIVVSGAFDLRQSRPLVRTSPIKVLELRGASVERPAAPTPNNGAISVGQLVAIALGDIDLVGATNLNANTGGHNVDNITLQGGATSLVRYTGNRTSADALTVVTDSTEPGATNTSGIQGAVGAAPLGQVEISDRAIHLEAGVVGNSMRLEARTGDITQAVGAVIGGGLTANAAGSVILSTGANDVASAGGTAGSSFGYNDVNDFQVAGIAAGTTVGLTAADGSITQAAGAGAAITGTALTATAAAAARSITLDNVANNVTSVAGRAGASFGFTDSNDFQVAGIGAGTTAGLTSVDGSITQAGGAGAAITGTALTANVLAATHSVTLENTANNVATLSGLSRGTFSYRNAGVLTVGTLTTTGDAALRGDAGLVLNGPIDVGAALAAQSSGNITQAAVGSVSAASFAATAGGAISMPGQNAFAAITGMPANGGALTLNLVNVATTVAGSVNATGDIRIDAARDLTFSPGAGGVMRGGRDITVDTQGSLTAFGGSIFAPGTITLTGANNVSFTGTVIDPAVLEISATTGDLLLTNVTATTDAAPGTITLRAGGSARLVGGTYGADRMAVTAGAAGNGTSQVSLSGTTFEIGTGILFAAGGGIGRAGDATSTVRARSGGVLPLVIYDTRRTTSALRDVPTALTADRPGLEPSAQASQVANLRGLGTQIVGKADGSGEATVADAGAVLLNLNASSNPVFLLLDGGTASGFVSAGRLGVSGLPGAARGSSGNVADLTGDLFGFSGASASQYGRSSSPSATDQALYRINGCVLSSINCVAVSVTLQPVVLPPQNTIEIRRDLPRLDPDVLLPNIAEEDY